MNKSILTLSFSILLLALAGGEAQAKELTVDEIVKKTNHAAYYQGQDGRSKIKMTITGKGGEKRVRSFTALRRNNSEDDGDQSFYIYFHKPADVAKMVFIAQKKVKGADDRWLYLPGLDLVKRIAASDERTSFVGSDFFYEDVSGRNINADHHKLLETTKNFYVLEHTPKKPGSVEFSSYKMWVHRTSFLATKVEYYNKQKKKYRVMTVDSVVKVQGYSTVKKATMQSLLAGTKTTIEYDSEYNIGLPAKLFGERYLRRAPLKYLK